MIIAIAAHKGGVGKTTTAISLAAALHKLNKNVLLIDLDGQCNLTSSFGIDPTGISIKDVFLGNKKIEEVIVKKKLDIVPSNYEMVLIERKVENVEVLRSALKNVKDLYDYIILDCPPSLGIFTVNALAAADTYIIPTLAETYQYQSLSKLIEAADRIKAVNPGLKLGGVLFCMHSLRKKTTLGKAIEEKVRASLPTFKTTISNNIALVECINSREDVFDYNEESKGATDYLRLSTEIIRL